jgi:hypothetical protein
MIMVAHLEVGVNEKLPQRYNELATEILQRFLFTLQLFLSEGRLFTVVTLLGRLHSFLNPFATRSDL